MRSPRGPTDRRRAPASFRPCPENPVHPGCLDRFCNEEPRNALRTDRAGPARPYSIRNSFDVNSVSCRHRRPPLPERHSMTLFGETLAPAAAFLLLLALGLALSFEFVNGFHDTANAVATVIYTHSLRPVVAVVWSGLWNLIGVLTSSGAVAFAVVALLPVELVLNAGSAAGFAMVFSLLTSAIIWNVGTWYFGLPASSSHALIGAILGVLVSPTRYWQGTMSLARG